MRPSPERKKRYGILLAMLVVNWAVIIYILTRVDPEGIRDYLFPGSYLPMTVTLFGAFFWLFCVLFLSTKRALRWSLGAIFYVYLRLNGLGSFVNGVLILGILATLEYYLVSKAKDIEFNRLKNATITEQNK